MPKGLFDAVAVGLVRDRTMVGNAIFSQHESAGPIDDAQLGGLRLARAPHPPRRDHQQSVRHEDSRSRDILRDRGGSDGRRRPGGRET